jgi:hypothetical protein
MNELNSFYDEMFNVQYVVGTGLIGQSGMMDRFDVGEEGFNGSGLMLADSDGIGIWLKSRKELDVLAHECTHAALVVLEDRDVDVSHENSEVMCSYVQMLFRLCRSLL